MGGYHPNFHVPDHYPKVPRLGLNWRVNDALTIKGQEYFALTAHALMAGGLLEAHYESGDMKAWFKVGADFLIAWKPYYYDARMYLEIGAEATIHLFGTHHISFDAGADLHLWGPPFAGEAHVHVKVIGIQVSLDVAFGSGASFAVPIDWETFKTSFLPSKEQICSLSMKSGLIRKIEEPAGVRWIVNPKDFALVVQSAIPITKPGQVISGATLDLGLSPMGVSSFESTFVVTDKDGKVLDTQFHFEAIKKPVPSALWGQPDVVDLLGSKYLMTPKVNGEQMVQNSLAGFEIYPADPPKSGETHDIDESSLLYETQTIDNAFTWEDFTLSDLQGTAAFTSVKTTVVKNDNRKLLLGALGFADSEIDFGETVDDALLLAATRA
jgi:hypothetical protein